MSDVDLEERITATLGRMAEHVTPSRGDLADIRRRVVRRRRSATVALCAGSALALAVAAILWRSGSSFTPVQQPLVTTLVTSPKALVPLWPDVLPEGATLVEAFELDAGFGSYGTGLLARLDGAERATAVWIRTVPGALISDPQGTPVALADGREAEFTQVGDQASMAYKVGDIVMSLSGTLSIEDLVSAANSISVSDDGVVTPRPGADNGWQVAFPPSSLAGTVEYRAIFEVGGERFVVSSSEAPPSISNPIQQSGPLTLEHTANGDLWHLGALTIGHRPDGTWVLVGSAEPPGLALDQRRAILASLRPVTPGERATFSASGDSGEAPDMPCRLDAVDELGRYTVQDGDSLNGIAACFGTTLDALLRANPDLIFVPGAELVIPSRSLTGA